MNMKLIEILTGKLLGFFNSENHLMESKLPTIKTQVPPTRSRRKKQALTSLWNDKGGSELFMKPFWNMAGFDLRKITLPNAWVSSYWKNVPRASRSTLINFKFWSPNFHLQKVSRKCIWNGETPTTTKSTKIEEKITRFTLIEHRLAAVMDFIVDFSLDISKTHLRALESSGDTASSKDRHVMTCWYLMS